MSKIATHVPFEKKKTISQKQQMINVVCGLKLTMHWAV